MGFRQAAADLGIHEPMLRAWAKSAETEGPEAFRAHGARTELEVGLAVLERENRILLEERDLKKRRKSW